MLTEAALIQSEGVLHSPEPIRDDTSLSSLTAKAEVVIDTPHSHEHTNSVNRSYSDLDNQSFLLWAFVLCAARTAAQQPLNLALARKQTSSFYAGLSTRAVIQRVFAKEGGLRGLSQGMVAMTLGCALSEVVYLFLFEYCRERAPLPSDAQKDAAAGYLGDAACRVLHIPLSIIAFRQMTAGSSVAPTALTSGASDVSRGKRPREWMSRARGYQAGASSAYTHPCAAYAYVPAYSSGCRGGVRPTNASTASYHRYHRSRQWSVQGHTRAGGPCAVTSVRQRLWGPRTVVSAQNTWTTLATIYRENGVRSVFAGYGTTIAIGCQWSALWWALYGVAKAKLYRACDPFLVSEEGGGIAASPSPSAAVSSRLHRALPAWCLAKDDNLLINTAASIVTSASTAVIFNPFLVVRTNLQTTPMATLRSATAAVYRTRGLRGFYSGLWLSVTTCVCDGMLASTSYEYAKLWSDTSRHHRSPAAASTSTSCATETSGGSTVEAPGVL